MADTLRLAELFRPRERLPLPAWSEEYRFVGIGPLVGEGGAPVRWSNATFPLQRDVLAALDDPRWTRVVLLTAPQAFGKTDILVNFMLERIQQRRQSVLYVSALKPLAFVQWRKKVLPAIEAHDELRALLIENRDEAGGRDAHYFENGATLHVTGAESVGSLSGLTVAAVVCDDVQAMPATLPGFGHPADIAFQRKGALQESRCKEVLAGTAGLRGDYLDRAYHASAGYVPAIACPRCGQRQLLEPERLEFARDDAIAARADAWLRCVNTECEQQLRAHDLPALLRTARWVAQPPESDWIHEPPAGGVCVPADAPQYPESERRAPAAGFWCNALYWPFKRWGALAVEILSAAGDPDKAKDVQQHIYVRGWEAPKLDDGGLDPAEIAAHAEGGHYRGFLPEGAELVTLTVDVQGGYVYYLVRAWRASDGESWLIDVGSTKESHESSGLPGGLEVVGRMAAEGWAFAAGTGRAGDVLTPSACLIDSHYMPDVVWRHCVRYGLRTWVPIQGSAFSRRIWGERPVFKAGRRHYPLAVSEAKTALSRLLAIPPGEPGYWHLPIDLPAKTLTAYTRHMTSELWDDARRLWVRRREQKAAPGTPPVRGGRNDWWDCETYQVAAALKCGVKLRAYDGPSTRREAARGGAAPRSTERTHSSGWQRMARQRGRARSGNHA